MNKKLRFIFLILGIILIAILGFTTYVFITIKDYNLDTKKLINPDKTISFYSQNNELISEETFGKSFTPINEILPQTRNAFIAIEDKRFYEHNGIDYHGLLRATFNNIKSFSLKEGGSTISQQLIKNTHLTSEKTLKRKLIELKLTSQLERNYSKEEILEKYLNTIYFGNNCYGITSASKLYFNKTPSQLSLNESAILASIVKAPAYYSPLNDIERCLTRKNVVLKQMLEQGFINLDDFNDAINDPILTTENNINTKFDYIYLAKKELNDLIISSPYKSENIKVKTTFNKEYQQILENVAKEYFDNSFDISLVLMDKSSNINAYYSTCGELKRQVGSIIKPLAVYEPAIEKNIVSSYTILNDEKTDFNGYSPSNFNDIYRGNIMVKDALAVSSNVCAVKLLNYVGLENSKALLEKVNLKINDDDSYLTLALGSLSNGESLTKITSTYNIFSNKGYFKKPTCINQLEKNNKKIIKNKFSSNKVIGEDTAFLMCDMLKNTIENGTAKKLKYLKGNYYAKTGTVGNKNGNSDAYIISFTNDLTLGVWCGEKHNKLLDNSFTGGNIPTAIAGKIWEKIYKNTPPKEIEMPNSIIKTYIDKECLIKNNEVVLSSELTKKDDKMMAYFKKETLPKKCANNIIQPKIESYKSLVNNNEITLQLCLTELVNAKIFRKEKSKEILVFDTLNNGLTFRDKNLKFNEVYEYIILPYINIDNKIIYGEKVYLDKIKTPIKLIGDKWWDNEFFD